MDVLEQAVVVHRSWKQRFMQLLSQAEQARGDQAAEGASDQRTLARWLEQMRQGPLGFVTEFRDLERAHGRFYRVAGKAVLLASHDASRAGQVLDSAEFDRVSRELLSALERMRAWAALKVTEGGPGAIRVAA